jgi:hypothetical protein
MIFGFFQVQEPRRRHGDCRGLLREQRPSAEVRARKCSPALCSIAACLFSFPNLPLLIEKVRGKENYYPMELCVVCKFQRVTLQQQTPAQMEKMIKVR